MLIGATALIGAGCSSTVDNVPTAIEAPDTEQNTQNTTISTLNGSTYVAEINSTESVLTITDIANNSTIQSFDIETNNPYGLFSIYGWSTDESTLWVTYSESERTTVYAYSSDTGDVKAYATRKTAAPAEFAIDTDEGTIVYSDYPLFLQHGSAETFNDTVTLYLHDFDTGARHTIAEQSGMPFNPRFEEGQLIYNNESVSIDALLAEYTTDLGIAPASVEALSIKNISLPADWSVDEASVTVSYGLVLMHNDPIEGFYEGGFNYPNQAGITVNSVETDENGQERYTTALAETSAAEQTTSTGMTMTLVEATNENNKTVTAYYSVGDTIRTVSAYYGNGDMSEELRSEIDAVLDSIAY